MSPWKRFWGHRREKEVAALKPLISIALFLALAGTSYGQSQWPYMVDSGANDRRWEVVTLATRPKVTTSYLLGSASTSGRRTVFILFMGGEGTGPFVPLANGKTKLSNNFLTRCSSDFIDNGVSVALIAPPSDMQNGMGCEFRSSGEHAGDVEGVIASLVEKGFDEIFLVGTSNGTLSAASAGGKIREEHVKGVILTSSVAGIGPTGRSCYVDHYVSKISYPVMIVHHRDDACMATPFVEAVKLKERIKTKVTFVEVRGGGPPKGGVCMPLHYHGFIGIEREVVKALVDWSNNKNVPAVIGE
jgi:hypothetical protein